MGLREKARIAVMYCSMVWGWDGEAGEARQTYKSFFCLFQPPLPRVITFNREEYLFYEQTSILPTG